MTRRLIGLLVTLALTFLVVPLAAEGQPARKMPRIGVLSFFGPPAGPDWQRELPFVQALRELGWVEGQNIVLEYRWADGQPNRLSTLAAELVRLPVNVLVVSPWPAIRAAQRATTTIPIVIVSGVDPLEWGDVATLARPGGNLTGVSAMVLELGGKQLEFLKQAVPGVTRMAILAGSVEPTTLRMVRDAERAAQAVGVHTQLLIEADPDRFALAFQAAIQEGAGALIVLPFPVFTYHQRQLAALALEHRLPAMYWQRQFAEVGGLMAYGPSMPPLWRRAAALVDKILKGAKPADLPMEQAMTFELVLNLKTAQALGLAIPPTLLFQADEIIR